MPRPCKIPHLPLRRLRFKKFADELSKADAAISKLKRYLESHPPRRKALRLLEEREAIASLHSQGSSINGYLRALRELPRKRKLTMNLILHSHYLIKPSKRSGHLRKRQNWIGPKEKGREGAYFFPPAPRCVPKAMRELLAFHEKKEGDPLVRIAIFFGEFLIIHPFMDGNGRVGRLLLPFLFRNYGCLPLPILFLSHYFRKNRVAYFRRLYAITDKRDWEGWIAFVLKGFQEECVRTERFLRRH